MPQLVQRNLHGTIRHTPTCKRDDQPMNRALQGTLPIGTPLPIHPSRTRRLRGVARVDLWSLVPVVWSFPWNRIDQREAS